MAKLDDPMPDEPVEIWTTPTGRPVRMEWRARRFRVSDTPTPLVGTCDWWRPFSPHSYGIGHPPLAIVGWRFQGTADDGETHVFDVGASDDKDVDVDVDVDKDVDVDVDNDNDNDIDNDNDNDSDVDIDVDGGLHADAHHWHLVRTFD